MARDSELSNVLVNDLTGMKEKIQILGDVLNVMDWAVESTLEELEENGSLGKEDSLLEEYRKAIKVLRQRGFSRATTSREAVQCPGCKAMLKDVEGKAGDRCTWCGHEFTG